MRAFEIRFKLFLIVALSTSVAFAAENEFAPPELTGKGMGHVRHIVGISRQMPGDWNFMYPQESGQEFNDAYRFQLAFMTYTLALVQQLYVPAYRELYHEAIASFIEKMQRPEVWSYWEDASVFTDFGNFDAPMRDPNADPVRHENIMYSGHLLMMIGLFEALYDDRKFDEAGSIVFRAGNFFMPSEHRPVFKYDHNSLAQTIYKQFVENDFIGVACEPNLVFPMCNQHAVLGLRTYDHSHGTRLRSVAKEHMKWYDETWVDSDTQLFNIEVKLDQRTIRQQPGPNDYPVPLSWANGWTGMFMHAWAKDYVERLYRSHIQRDLPPLIDGTYAGLAEQNSSLNFGFTAAYAAEVGDRESANALLQFADEHFEPMEIDGRFFYPRNDVIPEEEVFFLSPPRYVEGRDDYQVFNITGHSLLALARLNPGDGFWKLFNHLPEQVDFSKPYISDVSYPQVLISSARFDADRDELTVRIEAGTDFGGDTSLEVQNLSGDATYEVELDGARLGTLRDGTVEEGSDSLTWKDGELLVRFELAGQNKLVVRKTDPELNVASR